MCEICFTDCRMLTLSNKSFYDGPVLPFAHSTDKPGAGEAAKFLLSAAS